MSSGWEGGSTRAWRRVRADVLAAARYRCQVRTSVCTGDAPLEGGHVHHTLGKAITELDPRYLLAACRACNLHVGDPAKNPDPPPVRKTRW